MEKRKIGFYASSIIYSLIFAVIANAFIYLIEAPLLFIPVALIYIFINFFAGLRAIKTKNIKIKICTHGTVLLIVFCVCLPVSILFNVLLLTNVIECVLSLAIWSIVYCVILNFILFWNGIICVYLTSVQLGIKIRVIGAILGLVPIANLIALGIIINKTSNEVILESEKERINNVRKDKKICATKYPILMVHGVFFRDYKYLNYWGRVPAELERNGAVIYYGNHQSAACIKDSAEELTERIKAIIEKEKCQKVNIIAHSKGGLDCRYAIENYGIADYVASLTTINTPHRGCAFADWLLKVAPEEFKEKTAIGYNAAAQILGDKSPDFLAAVNNLTAEFCGEFDKSASVPNGIFTQSVGSVMKKAGHGRFPLNLSYNFVKLLSGRNDGLVSEDSFKWGENYTLIVPKGNRGVSHADMIDLNRENFKEFDVREFYVKLVEELKNRGL